MQLTADFIKQYLGEENADARRRIADNARVKMKERFRCEDNPWFQRSLQTLATNAYPQWYLASFFDPTVVT